MVLTESAQLKDESTGRYSGLVRYFIAKVLKTHKTNEINATIEDYLGEKSIVHTG